MDNGAYILSIPTIRQTWSIVIFCYNEVGSVRNVAEQAHQFLKTHAADGELVIVDDGSADGSTQVIQALAEELPLARAILHPQNRGIGEALRSGYDAARFENVCALPADGQFAVTELIPFASIPKRSFVSFYRKKIEGYNWFRNLLTWTNRQVNDQFLGIRLRDVNWVKIYKKDELSQLNLQLRSSLIESEICAKLILRGNQVTEAPSQHRPRKSGESKAGSAPTIVRAAKETYRLSRVVAHYRRRNHAAEPASKSV